MTTYTGAEFEIEFFLRMGEWAKAKKEGRDPGPDPRGEWIAGNDEVQFGDVVRCVPGFNAPFYSWKPAKPRTVTIGNFELVAPEREAPAKGAVYFSILCDGSVMDDIWGNTQTDLACLSPGNVFLTREAAQAMADVQRRQRTGEA